MLNKCQLINHNDYHYSQYFKLFSMKRRLTQFSLYSQQKHTSRVVKYSPTLLYQLRQGCTTSGSSMPLSSTYQMLKLKLGPQDKSGTLGREKNRKKKKKINIVQIKLQQSKITIQAYLDSFNKFSEHFLYAQH